VNSINDMVYLKIVILIALVIIIGLFKNYYVIIGSIITVTLF